MVLPCDDSVGVDQTSSQTISKQATMDLYIKRNALVTHPHHS